MKHKEFKNKEDKIVTNIQLFDLNSLNIKNEVIIWAWGVEGKFLYFVLKKYGIKVLAIGDNNKKTQNTLFDNTPILSMDSIKENFEDKYPIIITNYVRTVDIYLQLISYDFKRENLFAIQ